MSPDQGWLHGSATNAVTQDSMLKKALYLQFNTLQLPYCNDYLRKTGLEKLNNLAKVIH